MIFSSGVFLVLFLPISMLVYYNPIIKSRSFKNIWLLIISLFFYAWGEPKFIFMMLLSIFINWAGALIIDSKENDSFRKIVFILLILWNIGLFFVFKYLDFTIENINLISKSSHRLYGIALPIGISFFTFQIMSYVIDVYLRKIDSTKNLLHVALYVSMFPQLIAGPIVRYRDVYEEIKDRNENWEDFSYGVSRFAIGLGKKVILADLLAELADEMFLMTNVDGGLTVMSAWIGAIAYTLQIYFDFSGYSDMAIGLGRCFGFHYRENFNYPYIASSVTDFWRRWHISLTSWFRDYVYIPLGGNRCSKARHIFNLFVVWLLTGIWHGANWTFIVWGLIYFVIQLVEKLMLKGEALKIIGHIYTGIVFIICWVIFRSDNLLSAFTYIGKMFGKGTLFVDDISIKMLSGSWRLLLVSCICCIPWKQFGILNRIDDNVLNISKQVATIFVFLISVLTVLNGNYSPFVYFNF